MKNLQSLRQRLHTNICSRVLVLTSSFGLPTYLEYREKVPDCRPGPLPELSDSGT